MLAASVPSRLPAGTGGGGGGVNAQAIAPSQVLTEFERQWGTTFDGWGHHDDDCAEAHGLTCDVDGMITSMRVASQGHPLGSIPVTIGNLTQLTHLSITYCELAGSIPPILGSLTLLDALYD
ncbi:unnamed protein product [Closterium sp. NIES-65]|nr:unnamed protein product [Closterium sp. NIES-65]